MKTTRFRSLHLLAISALLLLGPAVPASASDGYTGGYHETGIDGTTVYLNDLEDHSWTYYAGIDEDVDGGNYNTNYKGIIYSPNPRDVEIHYEGGSVNGASDVAISGLPEENQNEMVYYLTLEEHPFEKWLDGDGSKPYPYQVISNPFSKRPAKLNDDQISYTYYGFAGWKIVSGGDFIDEYENDEIIPLDAIIHFTNLADDNAYVTGNVPNVIVLEATWTEATVEYSATMPTFTSGTYETNFWVLKANFTTNLSLNQNMTITAQSPDGGSSIANGNFAISNAITVNNTFTGTVKFEWLKLSGSSNIDAGGRNLHIGRGVNGGSSRSIYGCRTSMTNVDQVLKIESGSYHNLRHYDVSVLSIVKQIVIYGCDYDRAYENQHGFTNDYLEIKNDCIQVSQVLKRPFLADKFHKYGQALQID